MTTVQQTEEAKCRYRTEKSDPRDDGIPWDQHTLYEKIHEASGCPMRQRTEDSGIIVAGSRDRVARKGEFYGILKSPEHLPCMVAHLESFRTSYGTDGFAHLTEDGAIIEGQLPKSNTSSELITSDVVTRRCDTLFVLEFQTIQAAVGLWAAKHVNGNVLSPDYERMSQLINPRFIDRYGRANAVKMRIISALASPTNLNIAIHKFKFDQCDQDNDRVPFYEEMQDLPNRASSMMLKWADLHMESARRLQSLFRDPRETDDQVRYFHNFDFFLTDGEPIGIDPEQVDLTQFEHLDTEDGRFGCPGKKFILRMWNRANQLAARHIYYDFPHHPEE